ncbi:thermonuclease family protein [Nocardia gipuzkoensis]|uniref:thermonuclease family protein n=1 Tax=Nocardia gipuzkoensis TaxID=2749991 RepID=UPI00237E93B0|nr:thermonuclease family protein [Nocardia gipuzkoensis]MDE1674363.1 thermonuclease family protein [Nocardia gipuzkoensis]
MIEPVQVLWSPAGVTMPSLGSMQLVDITDGDTPNIRMPVRMLSVDTPEVTARTSEGAVKVDEKFAQLAQWIEQRNDVPITRQYADHLLPKIQTGKAGTLQFEQGRAASAFAKDNAVQRLSRPDGTQRALFVRTADTPFDNNGRLLAYVAPNYSAAELQTMPRAQRATFNLDMVRSGWAAPFVIYPSIPGELDLPLFLAAAADAADAGRGIWGNADTLPAYEYRAVEKLYLTTKQIVDGKAPRDRYSWRDRYCADMRTRVLYGPEDYMDIDSTYRLWIWSADVRRVVTELNLSPSRRLVGADH